MVEKCENCAFGVKTWLHHGYRLDCRRKAPIVFHGVVGLSSKSTGDGQYQETPIMGTKTAWPEVNANDFCGEWELQDARS